MKKRAMKKWIPKNTDYCYTYSDGKCKPCKWWRLNKKHETQENGFCTYLRKGDWDINAKGGTIYNCKTKETIEVDYYPFGGLLWDMCKECNCKNN